MMIRNMSTSFPTVRYRALILTLLMLPLIVLSQSPAQPPVGVGKSRIKTDLTWRRVSPKGEEFSFSTPVRPSLLIHNPGKTFGEDGEKVKEQREYSAYVDGFIFVMESYRVSGLKRLLKDMGDRFRKLQFIEDVELNGFKGKKYNLGSDKYFGYLYHFVTRGHVYILTMAARDSRHPFMDRFLSSLSLGDNASVVEEVIPQLEDTSIANIDLNTPPANLGPIFRKSKDVTQRLSLVGRPEPSYTERARKSQTMGTIILRAVMTAWGEVIVIEVVKGLKDGLIETAIEAAKNIRFLPAEKDGRPVSSLLQIEYNFNLY